MMSLDLLLIAGANMTSTTTSIIDNNVNKTNGFFFSSSNEKSQEKDRIERLQDELIDVHVSDIII